MNFSTLVKAFDAVMVLRETAKRLKGEVPPAGSALPTTAAAGVPPQIEARLTSVVVAALKEAFDRDHARMEFERTQMEDQRRRAEEAMRLELRRQAAEREVGRLRLLAGVALAGWVASVVMLLARLGTASTISRAIVAAGWLLLLGALGAAFTAQGRVSAAATDVGAPVDDGRVGQAALWLLIAGLALSAMSLLF